METKIFFCKWREIIILQINFRNEDCCRYEFKILWITTFLIIKQPHYFNLGRAKVTNIQRVNNSPLFQHYIDFYFLLYLIGSPTLSWINFENILNRAKWIRFYLCSYCEVHSLERDPFFTFVKMAFNISYNL